MTPAELLWADESIYDRRLEKSAAALISVHRALAAETDLVPGAAEFQRLYRWVSRAMPDHFTRLWSDPAAYFWVRRAVHLMAACRGEPLGTVERAYCAEVGARDARDALRIHLDEFKRFAIGLAVISGGDVAFDEPYRASLPAAIPGTRFVITGDGVAKLSGARGGAVENARIATCPAVVVGDAEVWLNPPMFRLAGIGFPVEWACLPLQFQADHAELVAQALSLVRRFQPVAFLQFCRALKVIALKPHAGSFFNISASELAGAFVCSVPADPYALAAGFIHEFHHSRLFFIEEAGPFFESGGEDAIEGENHYSPWVATPRPLHGIMHAVYVFLATFKFWSAMLREGSAREEQIAYARANVSIIPFQLRMGINQLRRFATFTAFGREVFEQLVREVAEAEREARSIDASLDAPAMALAPDGSLVPLLDDGDQHQVTVGEALLEHLEASDLRGECADERAMLAGRVNLDSAS